MIFSAQIRLPWLEENEEELFICLTQPMKAFFHIDIFCQCDYQP